MNIRYEHFMFCWSVEQGRPAAVGLAVPALCWDPYLSHGALLLSRTVSVDGAPDFALRMGAPGCPPAPVPALGAE